MLLWILVVVAIFLIPAAYLTWRFRRDDEAVSGGSIGHQSLGHDNEDWGPKS